MMLDVVVTILCVSCVCAVIPAVLFLSNLRRYKPPRGEAMDARVSVLIPARNEERNIAACLVSVLASRGVVLEVLVLDDASTDRTGEIVREIAARDERVRLVESQSLPEGWNGKQHACWLLAQKARLPLLLFLDADVRIAPDALLRCASQRQSSGVALLSGFPRQITVGWMEKLLLPLIHFVLLSFLPMGRMRKTVKPAYAAGCGQFFLAEREAYFASGGHGGIRETRHDGLRLPELLRQHGYRTDLCDLTALAEVRMYDSASAVWQGLAKNATEGIATPGRIVPFSVLLVMGQVLPVIAFAVGLAMLAARSVAEQPALAAVVVLAFVASYLPRLLAVRRFRQPLSSAVLHPVGVMLLLAVQWYALTRQVLGRPVAWRARSYSSGSGGEVPSPPPPFSRP